MADDALGPRRWGWLGLGLEWSLDRPGALLVADDVSKLIWRLRPSGG